KSNRFRDVAVGKTNLGTVRMFQSRYDESFKANQDAREIFESLGEPKMVAVAWHQTGIVHETAGQLEAAERAYRRSLALKVQQNDTAGEASTLNQLGNLYDKMGRLEETVIFYRQAADKYVEVEDMANEGRARNNLADTLIKLKRFAEARREIKRAVECKKTYGHAAQPWTTWMILHNLEQAEGNQEEAAQAREQAIDLYLAYRRDGGENHSGGGRLSLQFLQALRENKKEEMAGVLEGLAKNPGIPPYLKALISKLQAILNGKLDPGLAADPDLHYTDAAEILFVLEKLGG
ncbi:MAG: tetratricopeptide repeat protein, partial [Candidatus Aminicenantes bacterium]|nr:tetratricopeptide repeat protein [Candidatus Aminicenantes bacterium]